MDIILPGSGTPPEASGPTAAKPLAGRKETEGKAGGGRLPPPVSSPPELLPRRFGYFPDARRHGTRPRLNAPWTATFAKKVPQHRSDSRGQRCPQPGLHRIQALPEESGGEVKGGSAGARSARTLDGPEHSPTLPLAGQVATRTSHRSSMPITWPGAVWRPSIVRECSAPSRLPFGACGGPDRASALHGVGLYRQLAPICQCPPHSQPIRRLADEGQRAPARGFCAEGAGVYRADVRFSAERHDCSSTPGGGTAGGGPRPPRAGAGVYRADRRPGAERHDGFSAPGGGTAGGGPRPPRACTTSR
jgi:hypothetical protein